MHTGHYMTAMCSGLRLTASQRSATSGKAAVLQATVAGSSGGGVMCLAPTGEDTPIQTLQALQEALVRGQEHPAGLNPHAFR